MERNITNVKMKPKIFITGICGFIGTHLSKRLEDEGYHVYGIDNLSNPCEYHRDNFINGDILDIEKYENVIKDYDFIIHLAALINVEESLEDPKKAVYVNTIGTFNILKLCKKYNIKLIYASTCEIYGDKYTMKKMDEKHRTIPKSPYAASKLGADGLCHAYYHSYGTKVVIVRNYNTMGKYQSDHKFGAVIAKFANRLSNGLPPVIFGDGTQRRDYISYNDAIDFYMLIIKNAEKLNLWGEEYNVGLGQNISINDLATKMIKLYGYEDKLKPIHSNARPGEVHEFLCDNTKALKLGWKPNMDFNGFLKEYVEWKNGM